MYTNAADGRPMPVCILYENSKCSFRWLHHQKPSRSRPAVRCSSPAESAALSSGLLQHQRHGAMRARTAGVFRIVPGFGYHLAGTHWKFFSRIRERFANTGSGRVLHPDYRHVAGHYAGRFKNNSIVSQSELNTALTNCWANSPWVTITNNYLDVAYPAYQFTDPVATNGTPQRFYRLRWP